MHQQQTAFENIVGKGEIARKLLNQIIGSLFVHRSDMMSLLLNLNSLTLAY